MARLRSSSARRAHRGCPIRKFAKVIDVNHALPSRMVAQATGRDRLGFRLRPFDLSENIRGEQILKTKTVTRQGFLRSVAS